MVYIQYLFKETLSDNSGYKRVLLHGYDEFSVWKCFYDAFIDKLKNLRAIRNLELQVKQKLLMQNLKTGKR